MNANVVVIKRVNIFSFKNIKNLVFDLGDGENLVIEGKNGLGKSNILNAIYWCLTGYDLSGCSDNEEFVPYHKEDEVVDVEVTTNVGKFERTAKRIKGSLTQEIIIDGLPQNSLKEAEIEIDKRLGILPYTLSTYSNKDFDLRRFLLNPSYHFGLAPKTIRDILAKSLSLELAKSNVVVNFNPLFIKLLEENEITDITNYYEPIERLAAKYEFDKKLLKGTTEDYQTVLNYLNQHKDKVDVKLIDELSFIINESKDTINKIEEKLMILESGRQEWNTALENAQKGTLRVKLQTTTSKGIKKNAYSVVDEGINLTQCSTSESTMNSYDLVESWKKSVGCNVQLPIFIDRAESMNAEKISDLAKYRQVLITKVTTNRKIKINNCEVK